MTDLVETAFDRGMQDGRTDRWDPPPTRVYGSDEEESAVQSAYLRGYSRGLFQTCVGDPFHFLMSTARDRGYRDAVGGYGRHHALPENFSDDLDEIAAVHAEYERGFHDGLVRLERRRGARGQFRQHRRNPYPEGPDPRRFLWMAEPPPSTGARTRRMPALNVCASDVAKYDWLRAEACLRRAAGPPGPALRNAQAVSEFLHGAFPDLATSPQERLIVIALDVKNRPVGVAQVHAGALDTTMVDLAQVLQRVLLLPARSFIVAHNHPSDDPAPSAEDLRVTGQLAQGALALGLRLLDHVIVTPSGAYSSHAERQGSPA